MEEDHTKPKVAAPPDEPPPRRRPKKFVFPRRAPSIVIPPKKIVYITADKTTCKKCPCFPKEDPYAKRKKLNPCLLSPKPLYELAAELVERLPFPEAFQWSVDQVADWMEDVVGLPQYRSCILDNKINGRRLLLLENPSHLPMINIHIFDHIKIITQKIHETFSTDFCTFFRNVGLPARKPLTICTGFKARTGPTWGVRQNWGRCDILQWMKILDPAPLHLDHWDLVWYMKPEFPKTMFARIPRRPGEPIPHYVPGVHEPCREYLIHHACLQAKPCLQAILKSNYES